MENLTVKEIADLIDNVSTIPLERKFLLELHDILVDRVNYYKVVACKQAMATDFNRTFAKERAMKNACITSFEYSCFCSEVIEYADKLVYAASIDASEYYC